MAVNYKLYQCNRDCEQKGLWYARASYNGTINTSQLADIMQANSTVKRPDIMAALTELVEVMNYQLGNSMKVKLDGFGSFKIGLTTRPAATAKEFGPANVKSMHVLFQPEATRSAGKKTYERMFLKNVRVCEASTYNVEKKPAGDNVENGENVGK